MMESQFDFSKFKWLNPPGKFLVEDGRVTLVTEPGTDFWQKTYYGFEHDNAHAFLLSVSLPAFSLTVKTEFTPQRTFDQCGICLYQDSNTWFKASIEYDNPRFSRLGSVVTNLGFSDWASTDIDAQQTTVFYRLSRRGQDFLVETSTDGLVFQQMRIFHLFPALENVNVGIYACSPLDSSCRAVFSCFSLGECAWEAFVNPEEK